MSKLTRRAIMAAPAALACAATMAPPAIAARFSASPELLEFRAAARAWFDALAAGDFRPGDPRLPAAEAAVDAASERVKAATQRIHTHPVEGPSDIVALAEVVRFWADDPERTAHDIRLMRELTSEDSFERAAAHLTKGILELAARGALA